MPANAIHLERIRDVTCRAIAESPGVSTDSPGREYSRNSGASGAVPRCCTGTELGNRGAIRDGRAHVVGKTTLRMRCVVRRHCEMVGCSFDQMMDTV